MELEREPVELLGRRFADLMFETRRELGRFVNATADDLLLVTNATTALNTVARSLTLVPGDEVLATDLEYGATDRMWKRPEMQSLIEPLVVSWGDKSESASQFIQENEFQGTRDLAAYLSVPAAIAFMEKHDWRRRRQRCHQLVLRAREKMIEITGLAPLSPSGEVWFRQMAAQRLPQHLDGEQLHRRLFDEHSVEIPVQEANGERDIPPIHRHHLSVRCQHLDRETDSGRRRARPFGRRFGSLFLL